MSKLKALWPGVLVTILFIFVFLLSGCSNTMKGIFDKETAKFFRAFDITCYAPEEWSLVSYDACFDEEDSFAKDKRYGARFGEEGTFAKYEVSFEGESDEQKAYTLIKELVQGSEYYDEESLEKVSVNGCSLAYDIQGRVGSDSKSTKIWYDRFVLCKGALIRFHGSASEAYFDKEEFEKIYDACDFSRCEQLEIESISAEYEGEWAEENEINEDCDDIVVKGVYNNGAEVQLDGWIITAPSNIQRGETNEFEIEFGKTTCKLAIPIKFKCYEGYDIISFSDFSGIKEESHSEDSSVSSYNTKKKRMNYFYDYKDGYIYKLKSKDKSIIEDYLKELEKAGYEDGTAWLEGQTHWFYNKGEYDEADYMQILFDLHELDNGEWEFSIYLDIQD